MLINYWETADWETDNRIEAIKDENEKIILQKMLRALANKAVDLSTVEIETVNRCNNICSFCPVSRDYDIRTPKKRVRVYLKRLLGIFSECSLMEG